LDGTGTQLDFKGAIDLLSEFGIDTMQLTLAKVLIHDFDPGPANFGLKLRARWPGTQYLARFHQVGLLRNTRGIRINHPPDPGAMSFNLYARGLVIDDIRNEHFTAVAPHDIDPTTVDIRRSMHEDANHSTDWTIGGTVYSSLSSVQTALEDAPLPWRLFRSSVDVSPDSPITAPPAPRRSAIRSRTATATPTRSISLTHFRASSLRPPSPRSGSAHNANPGLEATCTLSPRRRACARRSGGAMDAKPWHSPSEAFLAVRLSAKLEQAKRTT
jgi:hypothetical protein